jgi:peptidoglycan L-alanyl-D-glutamate endopeptidase CwlK
LIGVNEDLVKVIHKAAELTDLDFVVTEGLRTEGRQLMLFNAGKSKTMSSRHITGHAVDLAVMVNGDITWGWGYYDHLAKIIKIAAKELSIPIEWGGDWKTFKDGPHFQLPWATYPK